MEWYAAVYDAPCGAHIVRAPNRLIFVASVTLAGVDHTVWILLRGEFRLSPALWRSYPRFLHVAILV